MSIIGQIALAEQTVASTQDDRASRIESQEGLLEEKIVTFPYSCPMAALCVSVSASLITFSIGAAIKDHCDEFNCPSGLEEAGITLSVSGVASGVISMLALGYLIHKKASAFQASLLH